MSTQTTALTAAGASPAVSVQPGQSISYSSSGTFTGDFAFRVSRNQGASWQDIERPAVDTNVTGATLKNETNAELRYRFEMQTDYRTDPANPIAVSGTCTAVITDVNDVVSTLKDANGRPYAQVKDDSFDLLLPLSSSAPDHPMNFSGMVLAANTNLIRAVGVIPTRSSGWTSFTGTITDTPAATYSDYRELHTDGLGEVLGFGSFPYMDAGASCASLFGGQDIAYVSTGATVLTAGGAPGVGVFSRFGKVVLDGETFDSGGVAAVQFLSLQANGTDVQGEDTSIANWEVASGGIMQMIKFACSAAKGATYLLNFTDDNGEPVSLTNTGVLNDISATTNAGWIRVKVGASDRYIPLYELKA